MLTMYLAMLGSEEDRERFTLLYEAHEKRLYAVALKVLRDPTRAEDAAQQTWLQVLRNWERINALVVDAISASRGQDRICQSPQVGEAMAVLKEFMFANVYTNPIAKGEESKAQDMLKMLFGYYQKNPDELPADFQAIRLEEGVDRAVCDYIAGMTDPFAVSEYTRLFIPMGWGVK